MWRIAGLIHHNMWGYTHAYNQNVVLFTIGFLFYSRAGRILIPPPPDAARRKGTQRLRCSMGRCSRRGSLKAAFRWWYQDAPVERKVELSVRQFPLHRLQLAP